MFQTPYHKCSEIQISEFSEIFFSKKKIILQFSFLDIFKNVHFGNFDPDFILGFLQEVLQNPFFDQFLKIIQKPIYNVSTTL
jgi:hypothetical protein